MYRKYECSSKIFGIIISVFFVWYSSPSAQLQNKDVIQQFSSTLQEKSIVLDSIKQKLKEGRNKIDKLSKKEGVYLEQLELIEKNIEGTFVYISKIAERIDTLKKNTKILEDSLRIVSNELTVRQDKMKKRLVNIYKTGRPSIIEIILTSGSIIDILNKAKYFQELNLYERQLARTIDSSKSVVQEKKLLFEAEQEQLLKLKSQKEEEKLQLKKKQKQRRMVLNSVKLEKNAYLAMIKELEKAQSELNLLIENIEKKRIEAKGEIEQDRDLNFVFQEWKGKLPWPVKGDVIKNFGKIVHPKYKTVTMSDGIDIRSDKGNKVYCVAPGKVYYIGWMRGYGKFILINHGGYITMYAHLDRINVSQDEALNYGTVIGRVGETGSLNGPKLHFQIRNTSTSKTIDPINWLEKKD